MTDKDFDEVVYEALLEARRAFNSKIEDYYFDPSFATAHFVAWVSDSAGGRRKIEIEGELK